MGLWIAHQMSSVGTQNGPLISSASRELHPKVQIAWVGGNELEETQRCFVDRH